MKCKNLYIIFGKRIEGMGTRRERDREREREREKERERENEQKLLKRYANYIQYMYTIQY